MGLWVRYIQQKEEKKIHIENQDYIFPKGTWLYVQHPLVINKVRQHASVFETADFDIKMIQGVPQYKCHGKIISTTDAKSIAIMKKLPWFTLKYYDNEKSIFFVGVSDFKYRLMQVLKNKKGTMGIYRLKGGWGDIVMAYSVAQAMQKQYPNIKITFACPTTFKDLIDKDPFVHWVEINTLFKQKCDVYIDLTAPCIRHETSFQPNVKLNRPEIFAKECMLDRKFLKPYTHLKPEAIEWAKTYIGNEKRPIISFIPRSCAPIRDWWGWEHVSKYCREKYKSTNLIFSGGEDFDWKDLQDVRVIGQKMSRVAALLSMSDIVLGVDTGPMHTAAALERPTVWTFTHIDGIVRTRGYNNVTVIQNKEACPRCPCWYEHGCSDGKQAPCGKAISVAHVTSAIDRILRK